MLQLDANANPVCVAVIGPVTIGLVAIRPNRGRGGRRAIRARITAQVVSLRERKRDNLAVLNILPLISDLAAKLMLRANWLALPLILAGLVQSMRRAATGTDAEGIIRI